MKRSLVVYALVLVNLCLVTGVFAYAAPPGQEPTPVPGTETVFHDDFSDPTSGWTINDFGGGNSVSYESGTYSVISGWGGYPMGGRANRFFEGLSIEVDTLQVSAPAGGNEYGIGCRIQPDGRGYYFLISTGGRYAIARFGDWGFEWLVNWTDSDVVRQGNTTNHMRVQCSGSTLTFSVNGEYLAEVTDTVFSQGDIVLQAISRGDGPTEIRFDNLVVVGTAAQGPGAVPPVLMPSATQAQADALLAECSGHLNHGYFEGALETCQAALPLYRQLDNKEGEAATMSIIGNIYSSLSSYQQALIYFQQTLSICQELDDRAWEAKALNNIGAVYSDLSDYEQALAHYQQALPIRREVGDLVGEATTLNNIGATYRSLSNYEEALMIYQQALPVWRELNHRRGEAATLNGIGTVHHSLSDYVQALDYFQQVLTISREIGDRPGEATSLHNIGVVYQDWSDFERALSYYQQSASIKHEIGDRAGEARTLSGMGNIYHDLSDYERSMAIYLRVLSVRQEIGDRAGEAATLDNIGQIHYALHDYEQAMNYYQQALAIKQEIGDRAGEAATLSNIGAVYHVLSDYEQALATYQQSLSIKQEIGDWAGEAATLNNIGAVYHVLSDYERALVACHQALSIAREVGHQGGEATTLSNIAYVYYVLSDYEEALEYLQQAIGVIEAMRGEMKVEELKSSFISGQVDAYRNMIFLLVQMERPDEVFRYVQWAKARAFLDQVGNVRVDPLATDDPHLIEEEDVLRGEIRALSARLHEEWAEPEDRRNQELIQSLEAQLEEKQDAYAQLLIRLKLENSEYASLVTVNTLTLTQTQRLLTGTTLVEYYVLPDQTLAFLVTSEGLHFDSITVTQDMLYEEITRFHLEAQTTLEGIPSSLQHLYDILIVPIEAHLNTELLIIAPHDVLHYVPFAALHDGDQYLVEQHALVQLPSASVLPFILEKARREGSGGPPLILGDPDGSLPFGRQEAQAVAKLYDTTAQLGEAALEQLVWEQGPGADILHLATHGAYNEHAPLFSRILLAADADEEHDGVLEVHEVYNLDLSNADLVVLSACQTNLGERSAGDEIVGLNRAFIYAGTPSVVASLWSVEDEATMELMVALYGYLENQGYTKAEALRQAQLDLLQNPDTAHPYYWAGFVLTGDAGDLGPDPSETPTPSGEDESDGGFCPGVALPLTLAAIVGTLIIVRRPHR